MEKFLNKICDIWLDFEEKRALFLGKFGIWSYPLKFYVLGRKIDEEVEFYKRNKRKNDIKPYLKKCFYLRNKFKKKLEEPDYYKKKAEFLFRFYKICC